MKPNNRTSNNNQLPDGSRHIYPTGSVGLASDRQASIIYNKGDEMKYYIIVVSKNGATYPIEPMAQGNNKGEAVQNAYRVMFNEMGENMKALTSFSLVFDHEDNHIILENETRNGVTRQEDISYIDFDKNPEDMIACPHCGETQDIGLDFDDPTSFYCLVCGHTFGEYEPINEPSEDA